MSLYDNVFKSIESSMTTLHKQIKLTKVTAIADMPPDMAEFFKKFAEHGQLNIRLMGILYNACITQKKCTFLFSKRIFDGLLKKAKDVGLTKREQLNGTEFKEFMMDLRTQGHLGELIRGTNPNEASVLEVTDEGVRSIVKSMVGEDYLKSEKEYVIKSHRAHSTQQTTHPLKSETTQQTTHEVMSNELLRNESIHTKEPEAEKLRAVFKVLFTMKLSEENTRRVKDMYAKFDNGFKLSERSVALLRSYLMEQPDNKINIKEFVKQFNLPSSPPPAHAIDCNNMGNTHPCVIDGKFGFAITHGFIPVSKYLSGTIGPVAFLVSKGDMIHWSEDNIKSIPIQPMTSTQVIEFLVKNKVLASA